MSEKSLSYTKSVIALVRGFFLLVASFFLLLSFLALVDTLLDLKWGYTWIVIPAGVGLSVAAYLVSRLIAYIGQVME